MKHRTYFEDFDPERFWDDCDGYTRSQTAMDEEDIADAETRLGYKLPGLYIELIRTRNGGSPVNGCFPTDEPNTWADDHLSLSAICGIGGKWGMDSEDLGSRRMIEEWATRISASYWANVRRQDTTRL